VVVVLLLVERSRDAVVSVGSRNDRIELARAAEGGRGQWRGGPDQGAPENISFFDSGFCEQTTKH